MYGMAGLLPHSPTLPLQPWGPWQHVHWRRVVCLAPAILHMLAAPYWWQASAKHKLLARPRRCWGASGIFQHLWGFGLACTRAHGSCYNQSVLAVAYPNTVCGSLQPDAGQGAPVSLVPPWQHYSHNSTQLAQREEERVRTRDRQCCRSTWQEGQQCLRGQPLALAIWPWKAAPGGLSVSETEDRCKMMSSDRAKQAMATRSSR